MTAVRSWPANVAGPTEPELALLLWAQGPAGGQRQERPAGEERQLCLRPPLWVSQPGLRPRGRAVGVHGVLRCLVLTGFTFSIVF